MTDNGVFIKRTTARKFSMMLPEVSDSAKWSYGTLVFFDRFKHCGIVCDSTGFYHAAVHKGTCRAPFTQMWSKKICGFRAMPRPEVRSGDRKTQ